MLLSLSNVFKTTSSCAWPVRYVRNFGPRRTNRVPEEHYSGHRIDPKRRRPEVSSPVPTSPDVQCNPPPPPVHVVSRSAPARPLARLSASLACRLPTLRPD